MSSPPALDPEHFRRLAHEAVDLAADYLAGIPARPVFRAMTPAERATLMEAPLGAVGVGPEALLERFRAAVLPHAMGNGHPRFFGWVNSPPAPIGVLADFLAAAVNPSCAGGDHAAIYVERAAVRWLMELIGFPTSGSMGLLASGGSAATLIALATARHRAAAADGWSVRREGIQRGGSPLVLYASPDGHSCIQKAVEILGLGSESIHRVATDERHRIDIDALRFAVDADRAAGKRPFCVAASAGTVSTGAIDPLDALADLCAAEDITFVLGHALAMKAIHGGKAKNDKIDSQKIAALLRGGLLPQAYVYPAAMRSTRISCGGAYIWSANAGSCSHTSRTRGPNISCPNSAGASRIRRIAPA